ncbi:unnamed protein product [Adineta ricciae]|uniref:Protein kinase domain-containing protein n=1 Tax=Adineta ricciae TaxID=249248 RepID=A0A815CBS0_ADIRI|nr:unnamed protein product [Adineta ricciae]
MSSRSLKAYSISNVQYELYNARLIEDFERRYESSYEMENDIDLDSFELIMTLGQGAFGRVILVVLEPDNVEYALKVLDKSQVVKYNQIKHVQSEIRILNAIQHANIIRMYSFFQDNSHLYVLLEYVHGGDLFSYLNRDRLFPEHITIFFAAQIVLVFEYLHLFNIIYRDLKPENILMDTHGYLKILIYELNTGNPPFKGQSEDLLFKAICRKRPPIRKKFSVDLKHIILRLLQKNPTKRLGSSARGSTDVKEHLWFDEIDFDTLYTQQLPSPFYENVLRKSLSDYRREVLQRNENPLVIAEEDDYIEMFKDF